jgi:hypothetical protein
VVEKAAYDDLRARYVVLKDTGDGWVKVIDAPTHEDMDAAIFQMNMDRRDAERYRFVRKQSLDPNWTGKLSGTQLDDAIDAAMLSAALSAHGKG